MNDKYLSPSAGDSVNLAFVISHLSSLFMLAPSFHSTTTRILSSANCTASEPAA